MNLLSDFLEQYPHAPSPIHSPIRFSFLVKTYIMNEYWKGNIEEEKKEKFLKSIAIITNNLLHATVTEQEEKQLELDL